MPEISPPEITNKDTGFKITKLRDKPMAAEEKLKKINEIAGGSFLDPNIIRSNLADIYFLSKDQ